MQSTGANTGFKNLKFAFISLICGLAGQYLLYPQKALLPGLLLLALAAGFFIYADRLFYKPAKEKPISLKNEALLFSLVFITGIFFRSYKLAQLPPGCFVDEGFIGLDILDVLKGSLPLYVGVPTDNPAVFLYFGALFFKLFGPGMAGLRAVSMVLGILTIPAMYFTIRYIYGQRIALLGAFIFSVMRWHVWFSRMGLHTIFSVLVFMLLVYFAARAYRKGKWPDFLLAGFLAGFSQYTYTAARLLPIWLALVLIFIFFKNKGFIAENKKKIIAASLLALFISLPVIMFAVSKPDVFLRRQKETSIFTKTTFDAHFRGKTILRVIAENAKNTALMFNYKGDTEARYNIPGEPMLDFFTGLCAFLGFMCLLFNAGSAAAFALVTAFLIIISPNVITESSPNACRSLMLTPLIAAFAAFYMARLMAIAGATLKSRLIRRALAGAGLAVLAYIAAFNYDFYFNRAARDPAVWKGFHADVYDAASYYNSLGKGWKAVASIQPWKRKAFDFITALGGNYSYDVFRIEESVPVAPREEKNYVYILSAHYSSLAASVFKILYPGGKYVPFYNKNSASELMYFAYEIPYPEIENLKKSGYKNGLDMKLYATKDWSGPLKNEKTVPAVFLDQDFGTYSWIWAGRIKAPKSGEYTFSVHSVGYAELSIDGAKVLENAGYDKGRQETQGNKKLSAGFHKIEVKYTQVQQLAKIELKWAIPGGARGPVPVNVLFPR